jgi:hypothetical protein
MNRLPSLSVIRPVTTHWHIGRSHPLPDASSPKPELYHPQCRYNDDLPPLNTSPAPALSFLDDHIQVQPVLVVTEPVQAKRQPPDPLAEEVMTESDYIVEYLETMAENGCVQQTEFTKSMEELVMDMSILVSLGLRATLTRQTDTDDEGVDANR